MELYEKALLGLECCLDGSSCKKCPYAINEDSTIGCACRLIADALSLLKAQRARIAALEAARKPRVMSLEELEKSVNTIVWLERVRSTGNTEGKFALVQGFSQRYSWVYLLEIGNTHPVPLHHSTINKTWRCWTSRPTDEQREATPWN